MISHADTIRQALSFPRLNAPDAEALTALAALEAENARLEDELRKAREGWDGWQDQALAAEAELEAARTALVALERRAADAEAWLTPFAVFTLCQSMTWRNILYVPTVHVGHAWSTRTVMRLCNR